MAAGTAGAAVVATPPRKHEQVLPARLDQVRVARAFLATVLAGCPAADEAIGCISELAANSCLHSASRQAGGTFTVRAEIHEGSYVWIEVEDNGGPWDKRAHCDGRPHGLDIVGELAAAWGVDGDPSTGRVTWARLDWPTADPPHPTSQDKASDPALGRPLSVRFLAPIRAKNLTALWFTKKRP
jgi:anti-sigma regulatory factor (Ser/Thr protein kinase)